MKNINKEKNLKIVLFTIISVLVIGVGYAAINNINLISNGNLSVLPSQSNFNVKFKTASLNSLYGTASITNDTTATIEITDGLNLEGDSVTATYTIKNESNGIGAKVGIYTSISYSEYFSVVAEIDDTELQAGDTTTAKIIVSMIKTPVDIDVSTTIVATLTAEPIDNVSATSSASTSKTINGDYTEVNYLKSTGVQYIDTGVSYPFTIDIQTKFDSYSGPASAIFGSQNSSDPYRSTFIRLANDYNVWYNCLGGPSTKTKIGAVDYTTIHNYVFSCSTTYKSISRDGVNLYSGSMSSVLNNYTIYLFATNSGGNPDHFMIGKIYYAKFYVNNVLVRDFIPVLDSNGKPCFFDKVEKKFYYSHGSSEILYG